MNRRVVYFLFMIHPIAHAQSDSLPFRWFDKNTTLQSQSTIQQKYLLVKLNGDLLKVDTTGNIMNRYSNPYLGIPSIISKNTGLQVVLFYPSFQTVILLDQFLNEMKKIQLSTLPMPWVNALLFASNKTFWYYDDATKRIKNITQDGQFIVQSKAIEGIEQNNIKEIRQLENFIHLVLYNGSEWIIDFAGNIQ